MILPLISQYISRKNIGAAGSQSSGLTFAGTTIGATVATEEYSVSHLKTVEVDGV